jgi:lysophospholipase L1-like esterase
VFYGEIAASEGINFEEAVIRSVLFDNRLKSDAVHPNGEGYAQVAAAVHKVLKKAGAI